MAKAKKPAAKPRRKSTPKPRPAPAPRPRKRKASARKPSPLSFPTKPTKQAIGRPWKGIPEATLRFAIENADPGPAREGMAAELALRHRTSAPKAHAAKPAKAKKPPKNETPWQRRIRRGMERGLTREQAAGKPAEGQLPASIIGADPKELIDRWGRPTPMLCAGLKRLTEAQGTEHIEDTRRFVAQLLGRKGNDAEAFAALFEKCGLNRRTGYNLFHSDKPSVGWDY